MAQQSNANYIYTVGTSSGEAVPDRNPLKARRTQLIITNTSAAAVVTVAVGTVPAVANQGIVLQPKQSYLESSDSGFECWQGAVQVIGDVAGSIAIVERIASNGSGY